jgi:putative transposase
VSSIRRRRSLRLQEYDYSQAGAYFVTICVQGRECLLGEIVEGEMQLNNYGKIARDCWHDLPHHYVNIELDAFVVMSNHMHGIIVLVGAGLRPAPTNPPLSKIIRAFKSFSSRKINELRNTTGSPVWQRGYYEHIIRDDKSLNRIREYIVNNPLRWELDRENLQARGQDDFDRWLASFTNRPGKQMGKS